MINSLDNCHCFCLIHETPLKNRTNESIYISIYIRVLDDCIIDRNAIGALYALKFIKTAKISRLICAGRQWKWDVSAIFHHFVLGTASNAAILCNNRRASRVISKIGSVNYVNYIEWVLILKPYWNMWNYVCDYVCEVL